MAVYSYSEHLQKTFGGKTYKVVVASGLTCPTRDGFISKRGCAFCDVRGSSSFHGKQGRGASVQTQIESRIPAIKKRFNAAHFLAYFQSYTNTYGDLDYLEEIYRAALDVKEVSGLCIGTRPDCLPDNVLDLLETLSKIKPIVLELGVQSLHNPTLEWLKRGHDAQCSIDALDRILERAPSIDTSVHLMFGSPTEPPGIAGETARLLSAHPKVNGVKLHQLMVLTNTELAEWYTASPFKTVSLEEYGDIVEEFLKNLRPDIYVERLYATATHPEECLAPKWSTERWRVHNYFRDRLK